MTPTVYRFDDPGAPQITTGAPSEYMNVIKKCLVDGYGDKLPLGWSVMDEDTSSSPFLAVKNGAAGTGGVFMIDASENNYNSTFTVQCAIDYVDRNTFARVSRKTAQRNGSSSSSHICSNWILIGTERCYYFICTSPSISSRSYFNGSTAQLAWFAGDIDSFINNDPASFTLLIGREDINHDDDNNMLYHLTYATADDALIMLSVDGSDISQAHSLNSIFGHAFSQNDASLRTATPTINILTDIYILSSAAVYTSFYTPDDPNFPRLRGKLPGLRITDSVGYMEEAFPFFKTINNLNHLKIPSTTGYNNMLWLDLESW